MPAGEDRRSARARNALSVGCWVFDWVQEGRLDLIIGCRVSSTTPEREKMPPNIQAVHISMLCVQGVTSNVVRCKIKVLTSVFEWVQYYCNV